MIGVMSDRRVTPAWGKTNRQKIDLASRIEMVYYHAACMAVAQMYSPRVGGGREFFLR
jgi:hypothetical protein